MTVEDVRARLDEVARGSCAAYGREDRHAADIRALLDDHARLRTLPVIGTCGDCRWLDERGDREDICTHVGMDGVNPMVVAGEEPPRRCPLRKAGGR